MDASLGERLQAFVGLAAAPPRLARDPVNQAMIRHWCDAMGDDNPIYTDPRAAAASRHGGIVAPPAMLQAWGMRGLDRGPLPPGDYNIGRVLGQLDEAGFTSVVATNSEQDYVRYLRLGDHLTVSGVIESVSDEKRTALGTGHFVTWVDTYCTDQGEVVGTMRFRVLKFRPQPAPDGGANAEPQPPPRRPRPAISDDTRFFWEGVERGELLIQRCAACGQLRHPPRPMCPHCQSVEWDAVGASGRGRVHSFVVPHHPRLPAFPERYVVALVDLEEGTRLLTNLTDIAPGDVRIGMPVELRMTRVDDELTLPLFRPARTDDELPELAIGITTTLIVAGAIASRDYQDVHHDEALARQRGTPGIFMNILTTNGLVGRYITDWAGPDATIRRIAIRLGVPNFAGDTMRLSGRIARKQDGVANVEIVGRNRLGDHVTGTVAVALP